MGTILTVIGTIGMLLASFFGTTQHCTPTNDRMHYCQPAGDDAPDE
jgi:hypothetical protein